MVDDKRWPIINDHHQQQSNHNWLEHSIGNIKLSNKIMGQNENGRVYFFSM